MSSALLPDPPIVKDRILLHLMGYTKLAEAADVPLDMTQEGIAEAVWIDIRHVVQYVRPLLDVGLVRERKAHIRGGRRRRKVYDLTDTGKLAAYDLREKVKRERIRVREADGVREAPLEEVLRRARGKAPLLAVLREHFHAGAVDLRRLLEAPAAPRVEMLADAPPVDEFVGREEELALLTEGAERARVLVIRGVPGIGKSTLAARLCHLERGALHLFWHRVRPWDTPASVLGSLGTFLTALGRPGVKAALSEGHADQAAQALREDLPPLEALLVLDDVHEAKEDLVPFLRFLKECAVEAPHVRFLVLTRRRLPFYDRRDVVLDGHVVELDLGELDEEEVRPLLPEALRTGPLVELARHPLFLRLLGAAPEGEVPRQALRDIHRFVEETVYVELGEAERQMMKLASLYRVSVPARALTVDAELTTDVLIGLTERALLTPVGTEGFEVHDSIREFFLSTLNEAEGHKLTRAALPHLRRLAGAAEEAGDLPAATRYLSSALQLPLPPSEALELAEAAGDLQERGGDLRGSELSYRRGLEAATRSVDRARLHRKIASALLLQGKLSHANREFEAGCEALGGAPHVEQAWLDLTKCKVAIRLRWYDEAAEVGRQALERFRAFDHRLGEGQALYQLAHVETNWGRGRPAVAREYLEKALALADTIDDPVFEAMVHSAFAWLYTWRVGHPGKAREHLEAVEALGCFDPPSYGRANFLMLKAVVALELEGRYEGSEACFREALALAEELHSASVAAYAREGLAHAAFYRGRHAEARGHYEAFAREIRDLDGLASAVDALCRVAECHLLEGDPEGFLEVASALEDDALLPGVEANPLETGSIQALVRHLQGDPSEALTAEERLLDEAEEAFPLDRAYPHFVMGVLLRAQGRDDEADDHVARARDLLESFSRRGQLESLPRREERLVAALQKAVGGQAGT